MSKLVVLPKKFVDWFASRGWRVFPHQLQMLEAAEAGKNTLLLAPTGAGKTLAGFLPSLIELAADPKYQGLHTLYISPLKALTADVARNLLTPVEELGLKLKIETRTGDTKAAARARQKSKPPQILLTTPESLALLLSYKEAGDIFGNLKTVVIDELHALIHTKRGEQLALCLARLSQLAPNARRMGLTATAPHEDALREYLSPQARADDKAVVTIHAPRTTQPDVKVLASTKRLPWGSHMALHAAGDIYEALQTAQLTIIFVNTRAQAELMFQELWKLNEAELPIGLHHGSLDMNVRKKTEAAMAAGTLRAVVATASLDLGLDWGNVDLVIQVGAPKGVSRLLQRIGRSGHRFDVPSRALLAPANRFELLECEAAIEAIHAHELDGDIPKEGGLDVLAQHIALMACSAPFLSEELYQEIIRAAPYKNLSQEAFSRTLGFVIDGGYALKTYEHFHRLRLRDDHRYEIASPQHTRRARMNIGTIVEAAHLKIKAGRKYLGEVEEYFALQLNPNDTFMFAGQVWKFLGIREHTIMVAKGGAGKEPRVPTYEGGRLPLSTHLAARVRGILHNPDKSHDLPEDVTFWLDLQKKKSILPPANGMLVETFPRGRRQFLVAYPFAGRNAHQTLGMLVTKRMERMGMQPLGFVASDYVIGIWSLKPASRIDELFSEDLLGDDLEEWLQDSAMLKRSFRNVAVIAGLIERRQPGQEKTGRQVTFNSDLIYDVLRKFEPDHVLLRATYEDASRGLVDIDRVADLLKMVSGHITHRQLKTVSPMAVPVLLDIGREKVAGEGQEAALAQATADLCREAGIDACSDWDDDEA